jgi:hypothetical protein
MIRHPYAGCTPCHADPSGAGLLTEYGRAQSQLLLRTRYGEGSDEDAAALGGVAWGLIKPPEWFLVQASFTNMVLGAIEPSPASARFIQMQADLRGQITADRFRANGSIGWVHEGAYPASMTWREKDNVVSREHWLGVDLGADKEFLLRAGRMNLPYGVRVIEHPLWARQSTRTDINSAQQHGVAFAYNGSPVRGELMGIAGNYQVNPDAYRERGYSAYLEVSPADHYAVGASSMLAYAKRDLKTNIETQRQAHGLFARLAPVQPLVFLAEADVLIRIEWLAGTLVGGTGMLQTDLEPIQGFHVVLTGETVSEGRPGTQPNFGGWLSLLWFFAPHVDIRVDGVAQRIWAGQDYASGLALGAVLHVFL